MTPAARAGAAIELLDEIIAAARGGGAAADTLIARYFKTRRYAGSKDRRAVRELVYRAIRAWPDPPLSGRAAMLGLAARDPALLESFDGSAHGPAQVSPEESGPAPRPTAVPKWLVRRFDPSLSPADLQSLLARAPLDLRVNRLRAERDELLPAFPGAVATPLSPIGLRLPDPVAVEDSEAWRWGRVEVQDEGSQLLALACAAVPGETVLDLCAGAGGKTLALAAEMRNSGRLVASDTDRGRLSRMGLRLARAGATIVETRLLDPGREREALADLVDAPDLILVDAPCSGTGTWRRNPELRWRLDPKRLAGYVKLQAYLLDLAAELIRPGGRIVYAVCSLLAEEGRGQAAAFEGRSAMVPEDLPIPGGRAAGPGRILTPAQDGTDGFFVARWRAPC
ncbi:MAG TPA: RsmB/NOP family class I SAM-dependent RNA methyltransferase [Allosphingosinicella sp.]|jgi:16S rRNA (cytosine967-C5)-methyltransferase|nr:RsmB/NOP family class I SAM-dependent RNA methyltransferase [Allosphingosinicella sp.]